MLTSLLAEHVLQGDFSQGAGVSALAPAELKTAMIRASFDDSLVNDTHDGYTLPTEEELATLRTVAGSMPWSAYLLCGVEFAERASYYGCSQVFKNFVKNPLPVNGNGLGAPPRGTQKNAGALGKGSEVATAMTESFKFLAYALPVFFGWLADTKLGRFKSICIGVGICGVAHVIMVGGCAPSVLAHPSVAIAPFALSLYMLSVGAGKLVPSAFKENRLT
jgi:dipeptide/tripeptide permease